MASPLYMYTLSKILSRGINNIFTRWLYIRVYIKKYEILECNISLFFMIFWWDMIVRHLRATAKVIYTFFSYIPGIPLKCIAYKKAEDRGKNEFIERYAFSKRYMIARDKMTGEVVLCLRWIQKLLGRSKAPPRQSVWNDVARSVYIYIFMYEGCISHKISYMLSQSVWLLCWKKKSFFLLLFCNKKLRFLLEFYLVILMGKG